VPPLSHRTTIYIVNHDDDYESHTVAAFWQLKFYKSRDNLLKDAINRNKFFNTGHVYLQLK